MKKRVGKKADKEARAEAHFQRGGVLYNEKRYVETLVEWRAAAALGHSTAMFAVGNAYMSAEGVAKDVREAHRWYKRAAAAGNVQSMHNLALDLRSGVPEAGIAADRAEALRLMRQAAEGGMMEAMHNMGMWLGQDDKDDPEQIVWFGRAVEKGSREAMNSIGACFKSGMGGLEANEATAIDWYLEAAALGDPVAMFNLGLNYENAVGAKKNLAMAAEWFECASRVGLRAASAALDRVKKLIDEEQAAKEQATSSSSTADTSPCGTCGEPATNRCSGCMEKFYCSYECQLAQWPEHKAECKAKQAMLRAEEVNGS